MATILNGLTTRLGGIGVAGGPPSSGGSLGLFIGTRVVTGTSCVVPPGANTCLAQAVGSGGSGSTNSNGFTGPAGGGAFAESLFSVVAGATISIACGAPGFAANSPGVSGIPTKIMYNGSTVAYADYGRGGGGPAGSASSCIGSIRSLSGDSAGGAPFDAWGNFPVTANNGSGIYGQAGGSGGNCDQSSNPGGVAVFYFFRV